MPEGEPDSMLLCHQLSEFAMLKLLKVWGKTEAEHVGLDEAFVKNDLRHLAKFFGQQLTVVVIYLKLFTPVF